MRADALNYHVEGPTGRLEHDAPAMDAQVADGARADAVAARGGHRSDWPRGLTPQDRRTAYW
jgi:hypothetical protein